ncbi:MAG: DUF6629 family protein [Pseudobdellovibrionaceae bacterium]
MCFSADMSFGSAGLLIATGAVTTLKSSSKQQKMIAAIPLLFGFQQVAEGIVWQTMDAGTTSLMHKFGIFLFLAFAFVVWPSWLPWSLYHIEIKEKRKRILKVIGLLGLGVSLLAVFMLYGLEIKVNIVGHSLEYDYLNLKEILPPNLEAFLYFTPTVVPFFISSLRTVKKAGLLVLGSMFLAQAIGRQTTASVWCFFAALISLYVAVNVLWLQKGKLS